MYKYSNMPCNLLLIYCFLPKIKPLLVLMILLQHRQAYIRLLVFYDATLSIIVFSLNFASL
jgi:hypothetical protein